MGLLPCKICGTRRSTKKVGRKKLNVRFSMVLIEILIGQRLSGQDKNCKRYAENWKIPIGQPKMNFRISQIFRNETFEKLSEKWET